MVPRRHEDRGDGGEQLPGDPGPGRQRSGRPRRGLVGLSVLAPGLMRRALALAIGLALAACTNAPSGSTSGGTVPNGPTSASEDQTIEGLFDVGDHRLFLECRGGGSPTIVFLHGVGGRASDWDATLTGLTDLPTCNYDRLNVGRSDLIPADTRSGTASGISMPCSTSRTLSRRTCSSGTRSAACSPSRTRRTIRATWRVLLVDATLPSRPSSTRRSSWTTSRPSWTTTTRTSTSTRRSGRWGPSWIVCRPFRSPPIRDPAGACSGVGAGRVR